MAAGYTTLLVPTTRHKSHLPSSSSAVESTSHRDHIETTWRPHRDHIEATSHRSLPPPSLLILSSQSWPTLTSNLPPAGPAVPQTRRHEASGAPHSLKPGTGAGPGQPHCTRCHENCTLYTVHCTLDTLYWKVHLRWKQLLVYSTVSSIARSVLTTLVPSAFLVNYDQRFISFSVIFFFPFSF